MNDLIGILHMKDTLPTFFTENNINVRQKNEVGSTVLHFVESVELAKYFVKEGVGINDMNRYGYSALRCAVMKKNLPLVDLLLENGANVYVKDPDDCYKEFIYNYLSTKLLQIIKENQEKNLFELLELLDCVVFNHFSMVEKLNFIS